MANVNGCFLSFVIVKSITQGNSQFGARVLTPDSRDRFMLKLNNCIHSMSFYFFCVKYQLYFPTSKFIYLRNLHIIDKKLDPIAIN